MPDEALGLAFKEEYTLEKFRSGEDTPYETIHIDADGRVTTINNDKEDNA